MYIYYDQGKSDWNARERGLSFGLVRDSDFRSALVCVDDRHDYGEVRYVAIGLLSGRLHLVCFTDAVDGIRVISLRKANSREVNRYAQSQAAR